jgi:hypothetical protein
LFEFDLEKTRVICQCLKQWVYVIPAQGESTVGHWILAFAGMTTEKS